LALPGVASARPTRTRSRGAAFAWRTCFAPTAYRINGKLTHEFPMTLEELRAAEPVYETFPGWSEDLQGARRIEDLPDTARRYIEAVERLVGVPSALLSVGPGPGRDDYPPRSFWIRGRELARTPNARPVDRGRRDRP